MTRLEHRGGARRPVVCVPAFASLLLAAHAIAADPGNLQRHDDQGDWFGEVVDCGDLREDGAGTVRDGGPMIFDGGGPGRNGGNNFSSLTMADDFALGTPTTIESIRLWSLGFGSQWGGSGIYRIYADGGGTPGTLLASGSLVNVSTAFTGVVPLGFTESEHISNLVPPPTLGAGTYWIALQSGDPCDASQQRIWETTTTGFGAFARRTNDFQCGETPSINMGFHMAFQLFGTHPPLVFDGGTFGYGGISNLSDTALAEFFELGSPTELQAIRMWTGEVTPWTGNGTYRIYSSVPGGQGPPGPVIATGSLVNLSRAPNGVVTGGFAPVFERYFSLNPAPELPAGPYWISVHDDQLCGPSEIYWMWGMSLSGPPSLTARSGFFSDCSGIPLGDTGVSLAFQLFGVGVVTSCIECADATVIEVEPNCGAPDTVNGGCNSSPNLYQPISIGDVVCGTGRSTTGIRDTDWYGFTVAERSLVTWSVRTDAPNVQLAFLSRTCPATSFANQGFNPAACGEVSVSATLDPGDYAAFVGYQAGEIPCGTPYKARLTAVPIDPCLDDVDPPTALCVAPFSICLDENGEASITADDIDDGSFDDCGGVELSIDRDSFDCSDLGTPVVVTLTVTDESDNVSTCQTTVTVEDCQDPVINNCPSDFTTTCNTQGGYVLEFTPDVTDNCGWTYEVSPPNPVPFGTNTVTVTVTDAGGNTAECSFEVTVVPEAKDPWRTFSIPAEDGWVRESDLVNFIEGPANSKSQTLDVGDDAQNWGRRGILSFDTSGIPASATITAARIRLTRASLTGNVSGLGSLVLDMAAGSSTSRGGCSGFINAATLESEDYHETETLALDVASSFPAPGGNGFTTFVEIDPAYFDLLDRNCRTQFRFGFATESDDDGTADYIAFHSGEAGGTVRPELIVEFYDDSCTPCAPGLGCAPVTVTLWSTAPEDGGLMESHWTSEVGGTASAGAASSPVGDTSQRQQLQVLLNFDTSSIPVDAVVTSAELRVYRSSATGGWAAFGPLIVGMRNPCSMPWWYGGSGALEAIDFQAFSPVVPAGSLTIPASNTYTSTFLNPAGLAAINRGGPTQMKLFFAVGDDGDAVSDQVQIATGNYGATSPGRPRLVVTYAFCLN